MSMPNAIRLSIFAFFLSFAAISAAQQSAGNTYSQKASFSQDMLLELPATEHLPYSYEIDITGLGFSSAEIARQYFMGVSDNLVHFEANEEGTVVTMRLQYQNLGSKTWTREEWNAYLAKKQDRFQDYLRRMNE